MQLVLLQFLLLRPLAAGSNKLSAYLSADQQRRTPRAKARAACNHAPPFGGARDSRPLIGRARLRLHPPCRPSGTSD